MNRTASLQLDVHLMPSLRTAIDHWLAARDKFKIEPSDETQYDYNATLHDLGAAWGERYSEDVHSPEAFQWYRRGLIAPKDDSPYPLEQTHGDNYGCFAAQATGVISAL
jgi:hypothetical protein